MWKIECTKYHNIVSSPQYYDNTGFLQIFLTFLKLNIILYTCTGRQPRLDYCSDANKYPGIILSHLLVEELKKVIKLKPSSP